MTDDPNVVDRKITSNLRLSKSTLAVSILVLGATIWSGTKLWVIGKGVISPPPPTNDSPVTVRGGSVVFRGLTWDCASNPSYCSANLGVAYADLVSLDGVASETDGSDINDPGSVPLDITTNWRVTFTFRDINGGEVKDESLELCSTSGCSLDGKKVGKNLFLIHPQQDVPYTAAVDRPGVRYDIPTACETDGTLPKYSKCNHIHTIRVYTQENVTPQSYHCVDGECSVNLVQ